jgi:glycosyltransferase involved in cell wall biosynthesis
MRVGLDVHVLTGPHQGTTSVWLTLLDALPASHEYVLYSFDPDLVAQRFPQPHFIHRRIPRMPAFARIELAFPVMARRDRCDAFHANYYGPLLGGPPLVLHVHDLIYLDFPEFSTGARRALFATLGRASAHAAVRVVTDSIWARERVVELYGLNADRVQVVPLALNRAWTEPAYDSIDQAWASVRTRVPARYALTVGRLDPRKNFAQTARVVRVLVEEGLLDGLVIVGPEDFGGSVLRAELDKDGTHTLVTHLNGLDTAALQAVYRHARCLVYLSLAEGFGIPLIEAMAMKTPIVASNRTSIPEVAGDAALIVDPDDTAAVISAIRAVLTDTGVSNRLVSNGRRRAASLCASDMARRMVGVYEQAAGLR